MSSRQGAAPARGDRLWRRFRSAVNMTPAQLRTWLATPESRDVGFVYPGSRESVGHASGRRIIAILEHGSPRGASDVAHMRKVIGYVARHRAQRPSRDVRATRWRYSLMNWGNDPLGLGRR